eukprot:5663328-Prymnesium_polylepis.1
MLRDDAYSPQERARHPNTQPVRPYMRSLSSVARVAGTEEAASIGSRRVFSSPFPSVASARWLHPCPESP